jgi:hypothetical protein
MRHLAIGRLLAFAGLPHHIHRAPLRRISRIRPVPALFPGTHSRRFTPGQKQQRQERIPMAKSQKRSNREVRKPKAAKVKTNASQPSEKPGSIKGLENMKNR